jgi:predicted glycosyltransferase
VDAKLLIARGGGATLLEAVYLEKPTVTVPRPYQGTDREQQERAAALAKLGHVRMITHPELLKITKQKDYLKFATEVNAALHNSETRTPIDMRGADNTAALVRAMIEARYSGKPFPTVNNAGFSMPFEIGQKNL